jgi:ribosomal protein S27AE
MRLFFLKFIANARNELMGEKGQAAAKGVCSRCGLGVMMAKAEAGEDETREYWEGARCIQWRSSHSGELWRPPELSIAR